MDRRFSPKHVLAAALTLTGLGVAGRAFLMARRPPTSPDPLNAPANVDQALASITFDTRPTPETVSQDVEAAMQRALELARAPDLRFPPERLPDLAAALGERLSSALDPNPDRDIRARQARGASVAMPGTQDERENYVNGRRHTTLAAVSLEGMTIAWASRAGKTMLTVEGFQTMTLTDAADTPSDAASADTIEIRVPIEVVERGGTKRSPVFVGFQFAWIPARRAWVPYANIVYGSPSGAYFPVAF